MHLKQKFQTRLHRKYAYRHGNSSKGIDFPALDVDIIVTRAREPQSFCPFRSARQKIYGLGYSLLIFAYEKHDHAKNRVARLDIQHVVFVEKQHTADFQTTSGLCRLLESQANHEDILTFFQERTLPLDEIEAASLAEEVLRRPPPIGYLTMASVPCWQLRYSRAIEQADAVKGIT